MADFPLAASPRDARPALLLSGAFSVTLFLGTVNALDEPNGLRLTRTGALASVVSQLPGFIVAYVRYVRASRASAVMLTAPYFVAATGLLAYLGYALNGKADSLNSAAHMHIVLFPLLHCFVAFVAYAVVGFAASIVRNPPDHSLAPGSGGIAAQESRLEYCSICMCEVETDDEHRCPNCRWSV